jgi:4'-phosphopantetheinyl transferase EntD
MCTSQIESMEDQTVRLSEALTVSSSKCQRARQSEYQSVRMCASQIVKALEDLTIRVSEGLTVKLLECQSL